MGLVVTRAVFGTVLAHAAAAHPRECCGLLLGTDQAVTAAQAAANLADDPERRFEIDPAALIAAHKAQRAGGLALLGYYHSHPHGPARPSATDLACAAGDGSLWAIVARRNLTVWRDTPAGFEALSYRVTEG